MTPWLLLLLAIALMFASGLFVAAEFSFVTVDRASIARRAEAGDRRAVGAQLALRSLSDQLSGAQLGITITNLGVGLLSEPAVATLLRGPLETVNVPPGAVDGVAVAVALVISTLATMMIGELVPKKLAIAMPMQVTLATQGFQRGFTRVTAVPVRILNGTANRLLTLVGVAPQEELRSARSPEELSSLVRRSADQGSLEGPTAELVARSIAFGDRTAADVMTPRVRVHFIEERATVAAVVEAARETGHSRFPVTGRSIDDIVGVVHIKQAVAVPEGRRRGTRVGSIVTPATIVPDTVELDPLLTLLRDQGMQMAVVVDEYGGTDGVVTLEDLVEELVGDIADEHDRPGTTSHHRRDGTWSLSGLLRPDEIAEQTRVLLPEEDSYETVGGLVMQRLGRVAERGDEVVIAARRRLTPDEFQDAGEDAQVIHTVPVSVRLRVDRLEGRRIDVIALDLLPPAAEPEDNS